MPMLEEVAASGDPEQLGARHARLRKRIMGFGHRVYRAEDPRSRILKRTARSSARRRSRSPRELEEAALAELSERHPERVLATNVEYYSALVLDIAEIPPPLAPAMFACSRVAGWSAHILEQKRTGRCSVRRPATSGPPRRRSPSVRHVTLAEAAAEADAPPRGGGARAAHLRREWEDELEAARAHDDYRERRSPTARSGSSGSARSSSCCAAGSRTRAPPCRGSALISLELLSRDHPGAVNSAPLLHALARLTTTPPCGGSRSSASRTARPAGDDPAPRRPRGGRREPARAARSRRKGRHRPSEEGEHR